MVNNIPPVQEGQRVSTIVEGFGNNDDPFVKVGAYVIFLKGVLINSLQEGDKVTINVTRVLSSVGFGELIS